MTDTVKMGEKRPRQQSSAVARNESALLVNPLDPSHIVGVEEITLPDGGRVISARISFDGGNAWRESWPLAADPNWAGVVGPVLAVDAHGTLHLAALAVDPDRSRASLVVYRSEDGGIHWTRPTVVMRGATECCYSIATDLNPASRMLHHPLIAGLAAKGGVTPAQVIFAFARSVGMLPLTGTSSAEHMKQDLASREVMLSPEEVEAIENVAG